MHQGGRLLAPMPPHVTFSDGAPAASPVIVIKVGGEAGVRAAIDLGMGLIPWNPDDNDCNHVANTRGDPPRRPSQR